MGLRREARGCFLKGKAQDRNVFARRGNFMGFISLRTCEKKWFM